MGDGAQRSLAQWLSYIEQTHPQSVALGLERVQTVADRLGLLKPAALSVLIAGTNGKGSTAIALESLLLGTGAIRVGVTLSPHLNRFNERIRVQGQAIEDAPIVDAFAAIEAAREETPLTYFEFAALAALHCFAAARCDVVVLEIGLGGRLDAFNIIDADFAVITSIGLDHQAWLGDTLDAIGAEKAGILRARQRVFLGPAMPSSVLERAKELGVDARRLGTELLAERDASAGRLRLTDRRARISTPWLEDRGFVPTNVALAWATGRAVLQELNVAPPASPELERWAQSLSMPGRCERRAALGCHWLLDVGHNPMAAEYLAERIPALCASEQVPVAVFGCLEDKPAEELMAQLAPRVGQWVLVPTDGPRGQSSRALGGPAESLGLRAHQATSIEQGLRLARGLAAPGSWILVFGGFHVVGAARTWFEANAATAAVASNADD